MQTLAVGVNLRELHICLMWKLVPFRRTVPAAHTVVIKGVKMWQNGGWQEYSDLDFIQMIGRAVGRFAAYLKVLIHCSA